MFSSTARDSQCGLRSKRHAASRFPVPMKVFLRHLSAGDQCYRRGTADTSTFGLLRDVLKENAAIPTIRKAAAVAIQPATAMRWERVPKLLGRLCMSDHP